MILLIFCLMNISNESLYKEITTRFPCSADSFIITGEMHERQDNFSSAASILVRDCVFSDIKESKSGGCIYFNEINSNISLTVNNSVFVDVRTSAPDAGAIFYDGIAFTASFSVFKNCSAKTLHHAFYTSVKEKNMLHHVTIELCPSVQFIENSTNSNRPVEMRDGEVTVKQVNMSKNVVNSFACGLVLYSSKGITVEYSTIQESSGGVMFQGETNVNNDQVKYVNFYKNSAYSTEKEVSAGQQTFMLGFVGSGWGFTSCVFVGNTGYYSLMLSNEGSITTSTILTFNDCACDFPQYIIPGFSSGDGDQYNREKIQTVDIWNMKWSGKSDPDGLSWWAILIIVFAAILVIVLIVLICALCVCKKKDKSSDY